MTLTLALAQTLKVWKQNWSRRHSKKFSLLFSENKTLHFMWIVCWQTIHMKCKILFSLKKCETKIKLSSAAVMISTLQVKFKSESVRISWISLHTISIWMLVTSTRHELQYIVVLPLKYSSKICNTKIYWNSHLGKHEKEIAHTHPETKNCTVI